MFNAYESVVKTSFSDLIDSTSSLAFARAKVDKAFKYVSFFFVLTIRFPIPSDLNAMLTSLGS